MILKKLNVKCDEVISIGDSIIDKQMSDNGGVRFIGAIWDSEDIDELQSCVCITTPSDIMTVTI
jgi:phosphoglycolate phosphatase-like HAD superfamily hydrolase